MDIKYKNNNYQFSLRVSSVILDKSKSKVLIFNVEGSDYSLLPGGKVNEGEESIDAIKREINEETGIVNIDYSFLAISEELIPYNGTLNQQINMIYLGIYKDEINDTKFKGLEGDWINFEWIDIKDIDNYNLNPKSVKNVFKDLNKIYHFVENSSK